MTKHQALLHIRRIEDDMVFFQPYDREVARISLKLFIQQVAEHQPCAQLSGTA